MNENLSREHIRELWRRMTDIYGHKWSSQHGEIDHDDTWLRGLQDLTVEQLSYGLTQCALQEPDHNGDTWAPTLPEFRSMCKPSSKPAIHDEFHELPAPTLSKEQKLEHISKLREALK